MAELDVSGVAKSIVKSFYELGALGQITSFAPMLADDFELFVPPYLPWGGHFNKVQYIALLPQVVKALDFAPDALCQSDRRRGACSCAHRDRSTGH